jgi:AcrR family transcriptional regulator
MAIGLSEAAAATGVNRSTIYRAFKAGRLSATRTDTGQIEVEPAELFRVFPPIASQQSAPDAAPYGATDGVSTHIALHDSALEHELQQLRDALAAMREDRDATRVDRDAWRDLARKEGDERRELAQRLALAAPIAAPGPGAPPEAAPINGVSETPLSAPEPRRSLLRYWFGWRAAG